MGESFYIFISIYLEASGVARDVSLSAITAFLLGGILFKYPISYLMDTVGKYSVSIAVIILAVLLNYILISVDGGYMIVLSLALMLGGVLYSLTIVGDTMVATFMTKHEQQDASTISIVVYFIGGFLGNTFIGLAMDKLGVATLPIITAILAIAMGICMVSLKAHASKVVLSKQRE